MADQTEMPTNGDFNIRYAKDGKGHDFAPSYCRNQHALASSGDMTPLVTDTGDDVRNMRYAKDGKGFDFAASYPYHKH
jgi:hypothetical protein